MKRLLLLLCLSAAVRPAAAQTAVSGFVRSLPERLARPLDDTLVVLRDLELLAPRRVMQSFDVVSDSTIYISQLGAFENHVPGRTRSHEVYVFEVRPGCDTMPRMTLRYFGHGTGCATRCTTASTPLRRAWHCCRSRRSGCRRTPRRLSLIHI